MSCSLFSSNTKFRARNTDPSSTFVKCINYNAENPMREIPSLLESSKKNGKIGVRGKVSRVVSGERKITDKVVGRERAERHGML